MTKLTKLLVLLLIIVLSVSTIYKLSTNKINYLSIGDGLSLGIDSYGKKDYGYSDYVSEFLLSKDILNIYTKDFSEKEMSIYKMKNIIQTNEKVIYKNRKLNIKQLLSEASIVTMSIGINDLIYKMSISNNLTIDKINKIVEEIYEEFLLLLKVIRQYNSNDIYIIGYYISSYYDYKFNYAIEKLNLMFQQTSNIIYIDTNHIIGNNKKYLLNPHSYYPNSEGYKEISRKIIEKITKKLEKTKKL